MTNLWKVQVLKNGNFKDFMVGFYSFQKADEWVCDYVKENGLWISDYRVIEQTL